MLSHYCFRIYPFFHNPCVSSLILALSHFLSLELSNNLTPDTHLSFTSFVPQNSIGDIWIFRPDHATSVSTFLGSHRLQNQLQTPSLSNSVQSQLPFAASSLLPLRASTNPLWQLGWSMLSMSSAQVTSLPISASTYANPNSRFG